MGRKSTLRRLGVWMNGEAVGYWGLKANGTSEFGYVESWLTSPQRRPISLSMPLRPVSEPYVGPQVERFFDNLLPDTEKIKERLRSKFGASSTGAFDLLEHLGRDCVGAVQLLTDEEQPTDVRRIQGVPLTVADIEQLLDDGLTQSSPFRGNENEDDFRISLAGAQEKTALLKQGSQWLRPVGPTPTTHILKLPIGSGNRGLDMSTSVQNEWLCAKLLAAFDVPVANSEIRTFGKHTVLEVERFDRVLSSDGKWLVRLPQEDFCQVTGTPGALKYEVEGGPGIPAIMKLLRGSVVAEQDRLLFMRIQVLFWLLCAIDGHAKNFSIFLLAESRFRLTPSYDVLSAYPVLGNAKNQLSSHKVKMAMAVSGKNRHYHWNEIRVEHWLATAEECGLGAKVEALLKDILARVPSAIETVSAEIPSDFPRHVCDSILQGLQKSADKLTSQA